VTGADRGDGPPVLDRLAEHVFAALAVLGLNPIRLRWKWSRLRERVRGRRAETANLARGVRFRHRMCPGCRALVPASSARCPECGAPPAGGSRHGAGRLADLLLPGIPGASALLLSANFAVFLLMAARAGFAPLDGAGAGIGALFRILSFDPGTLIRYGSGHGGLLLFRDEWWRLLCPIFLHQGLVHLLCNTLIFVQIGPLMEREYGRDKFLLLYVLSGAGGFVASEVLRYYLQGRFVNTVGASGAVFGLVGGALAFGARRGGAYGSALRSLMLRWTVYFVVFGFLVPGTDNFAHLGGLATGACFGALVPARAPRSRAAASAWRLASALALAAMLLAFLMAGWRGSASLEWLRSLGA